MLIVSVFRLMPDTIPENVLKTIYIRICIHIYP